MFSRQLFNGTFMLDTNGETVLIWNNQTSRRPAQIDRYAFVGMRFIGNLSGARLRSSLFIKCDFSAAQLDGTDLRGSLFDSDTSWPEGFDPAAHGLCQAEFVVDDHNQVTIR